MYSFLSFGRVAAVGGLVATLLTGCNSSDSGTATSDNSSGEQPFVAAAGNDTDPQTASRPGNEPVAAVPGPPDPSSAATTLPSIAPDSLHLLSPGRAGRLRLNMTSAEIEREIPSGRRRKTTRSIDGVAYPVYFVQDAQEPSAPPLELEMKGDEQQGYRIWRIRVMNPAYRTATGVGVGTPFGVARQQYGLSKLKMTDAGFAAMSNQMDMAWLLDSNSVPNKPIRAMRSAEIPPATRIVGVLLTQ